MLTLILALLANEDGTCQLMLQIVSPIQMEFMAAESTATELPVLNATLDSICSQTNAFLLL